MYRWNISSRSALSSMTLLYIRRLWSSLFSERAFTWNQNYCFWAWRALRYRSWEFRISFHGPGHCQGNITQPHLSFSSVLELHLHRYLETALHAPLNVRWWFWLRHATRAVLNHCCPSHRSRWRTSSQPTTHCWIRTCYNLVSFPCQSWFLLWPSVSLINLD